MPSLDPSTLSNYTSFTVGNVSLYFDIDFDSKSVSGLVTYPLTAAVDVSEVVLDTSFLTVKNASVEGQQVLFTIDPRKEPLGSALHIPAAYRKDESFEVTVVFQTTDSCTALQFLDRDQTDGKKLPYLFSQCQAIHARSLVPCFDTPAVKATYSMSASSPYPVLMSGLSEKDSGNTYYFKQPVPIPSYLIAIASGDITLAPIGPRSHVFCEPTNIDKCQYEFEHDMESFIEAAEKIVFPYEWKNYDALVLPTSFPYGGMENPNITFATPTLISGDRENVDVMAHELAHSWSGNLVTNCSWEHFWLNEGWTVYLERRIQGSIHGSATRDFSAIIGWIDLENSIKAMGANAEKYSKLVVDLQDGSDPDDAFSTVPYEKGSTLLYHIENVVGGIDKFSPFIPYYFNKFRYKSLDTTQFLDTLYEFFTDDRAKLDSIDWDAWLHSPGMPPVKPNFDTTLVDEVYSLADKWIHVTKNDPNSIKSVFKPSDIKKFTANQSVVFLETLSSFDKSESFKWSKHQDALRQLCEIYSAYSDSENCEVLFRWFMLQVGGQNTTFFDKLGKWLGTVGRMKFVRPGYVLLNKVDHDLAMKYFRQFESSYHPICRAMVRKDLGV